MSRSKLVDFLYLPDLGIAERAGSHEGGAGVAELIVVARLEVAVLLAAAAVAAGPELAGRARDGLALLVHPDPALIDVVRLADSKDHFIQHQSLFQASEPRPMLYSPYPFVVYRSSKIHCSSSSKVNFP